MYVVLDELQQIWQQKWDRYLIFIVFINYFWNMTALRGYCISNQKFACFVLYLKIINTFMKNNISYSKFSKKLKNGIEIWVGPAVLKLWIKIIKILFDQ